MRRLPGLCIQSALFNSTQAGDALKRPPVPPTLTAKVPCLVSECSSFIVFAYVIDTDATGSMLSAEYFMGAIVYQARNQDWFGYRYCTNIWYQRRSGTWWYEGCNVAGLNPQSAGKGISACTGLLENGESKVGKVEMRTEVFVNVLLLKQLR